MAAPPHRAGTMGAASSGKPRSVLPMPLRQQLKPLYVAAQRFIARTVFAYSPERLESAVRSLGIGEGDNVFLHSGFRRTSGFTGGAGDVIECLLRIIGPDGHLLMMSIPVRGPIRRYFQSDPLFDVARTPSAVGLISEVFRRRDDVRRSLNPIHPVLASGPLAAWVVADHEKSLYSCGRGSPFERFLSLNGKFLFFDAPFRSLTFMHYIEHQFRDRLPVELYDSTAVSMRAKDQSGRDLTVRNFFFSEEARDRRNFAPVERALRQERSLQAARIGNTRLLSVSARSVLECAGRLLNDGTGFYK